MYGRCEWRVVESNDSGIVQMEAEAAASGWRGSYTARLNNCVVLRRGLSIRPNVNSVF
jgi:hypothetical protein